MELHTYSKMQWSNQPNLYLWLQYGPLYGTLSFTANISFYKQFWFVNPKVKDNFWFIPASDFGRINKVNTSQVEWVYWVIEPFEIPDITSLVLACKNMFAFDVLVMSEPYQFYRLKMFVILFHTISRWENKLYANLCFAICLCGLA